MTTQSSKSAPQTQSCGLWPRDTASLKSWLSYLGLCIDQTQLRAEWGVEGLGGGGLEDRSKMGEKPTLPTTFIALTNTHLVPAASEWLTCQALIRATNKPFGGKSTTLGSLHPEGPVVCPSQGWIAYSENGLVLSVCRATILTGYPIHSYGISYNIALDQRTHYTAKELWE